MAAAFLFVRPPGAEAAADRYGGVWHAGKGTGAFVPVAAGMTWKDDSRGHDYNFDDDLSSPAAPGSNDYGYETGHRDFDAGIMIHSSSSAGACWSAPRAFPVPKAILREALLLAEDW